MSYEVGYGRPPKHSQYKEGESGNWKGRPKRQADQNSLQRIGAKVFELLKEPIGYFNEAGRKGSAQSLEIVIRQHVNKAMQKGQTRAAKCVFDLLKYIEKTPDRKKIILVLDEIDSRA